MPFLLKLGGAPYVFEFGWEEFEIYVSNLRLSTNALWLEDMAAGGYVGLRP